jgi:hypothetical protein
MSLSIYYILNPITLGLDAKSKIFLPSSFFLSPKKLGRKMKRENVVAAATASHVQF